MRRYTIDEVRQSSQKAKKGTAIQAQRAAFAKAWGHEIIQCYGKTMASPVLLEHGIHTERCLVDDNKVACSHIVNSL